MAWKEELAKLGIIVILWVFLGLFILKNAIIEGKGNITKMKTKEFMRLLWKCICNGPFAEKRVIDKIKADIQHE